MTTVDVLDRRAVVRRGERLTWATIGYNSLEAVLAIGAGLAAGSVALVGFGFDSVIELGSSVAGLWRLRADAAPAQPGTDRAPCPSAHRLRCFFSWQRTCSSMRAEPSSVAPRPTSLDSGS